MNEKQIERLLVAVESIAKSLASIDGGMKDMAESRDAELSSVAKVYKRVSSSDGEIRPPLSRKDAAVELNVHVKTVNRHAEKLKLPTELASSDIEKIRVSMASDRRREHLRKRMGAKWGKSNGLKKVS